MHIFLTSSPRKYSLASSRSRPSQRPTQDGTLDLSVNGDKARFRLPTDKLEEERLPSSLSYRTHRTLSHFPGGMCSTLNVSHIVGSKRPRKEQPSTKRCNVTLELDIPQKQRQGQRARQPTPRLRTKERERQSYNLHQPNRDRRFVHLMDSMVDQNSPHLNGLVEYFTNYGEEDMSASQPAPCANTTRTQRSPNRRAVRPLLAIMLRQRLKTQTRNRLRLQEQKRKQLNSQHKVYLNKFLQLL